MKHFTVLDTGPLCFCLQPPYIVPWNALPPPPPPKGCCPQGWPASRPASLSGLSPLSGQKQSSLSRTASSCSTHPSGLTWCRLPCPSCRFACIPTLFSFLRNNCHVTNVRKTRGQRSHAGVKAGRKAVIILSDHYPLSELTLLYLRKKMFPRKWSPALVGTSNSKRCFRASQQSRVLLVSGGSGGRVLLDMLPSTVWLLNQNDSSAIVDRLWLKSLLTCFLMHAVQTDGQAERGAPCQQEVNCFELHFSMVHPVSPSCFPREGWYSLPCLPMGPSAPPSLESACPKSKLPTERNSSPWIEISHFCRPVSS